MIIFDFIFSFLIFLKLEKFDYIILIILKFKIWYINKQKIKLINEFNIINSKYFFLV